MIDNYVVNSDYIEHNPEAEAKYGYFWRAMLYLTQFTKVDEFAADLERCFYRVYVPAKTKLLDEDDTCSNVYFLEKGLVRCYYNVNGHEVVNWMLHESQFITAVRSFSQQSGSYEVIETLEDCVLTCISNKDLMRMVLTYHSAAVGMFSLYTYHNVQRDFRNYMLRAMSAEDKLRHIVKSDPVMISRVTLKMLAAYLDIAPETLCRIMKTDEFAHLCFKDMKGTDYEFQRIKKD